MGTRDLSRLCERLNEAAASPLKFEGSCLNDALEVIRSSSANDNEDDLLKLIAETVRLAFLTGNANLAVGAATHGVTIARRGDRPFKLRTMLTLRSCLLAESGHFAQSLEDCCGAIELSELLRSDIDLAISWGNFGTFLVYADHARLAAPALRRSLDHLARLKDHPAHTEILRNSYANLALVHAELGEVSAGILAALRAIELPLDTSSPWHVAAQANSYRHLTLLFTHLRDISNARKFADAAERLETLPAFSTKAAQALSAVRGILAVCEGRPEEGLQLLEDCWRSTRSAKGGHETADLKTLINLATMTGMHERARNYRMALARLLEEISARSILSRHAPRFARVLDSHSTREQFFRAPAATWHEVERQTGSSAMPALLESADPLLQLAVVAELCDDESGEHPFRVAKLACLIAKKMQVSLSTQELYRAALLHDIGKAGTPKAILRKPGKLDDQEKAAMRSHASLGAFLLTSTSDSSLEHAVDVARHHHEWWNGDGYPDGLSGHSIPLSARIVSVCEAFDAMTHDRAYRPRYSVARAVEIIKSRAAEQFDPTVCDALAELIENLQGDHKDLDTYLAKEGNRASLLLRTRQRLSAPSEPAPS